MRSFQINVSVSSPLTLRYQDRPDDRDAMARLLSDILTDVSLDVAEFARSRLKDAQKAASNAGYEIDIPALPEPMGASYGFTDVTGHVGQKWRQRGRAE